MYNADLCNKDSTIILRIKLDRTFVGWACGVVPKKICKAFLDPTDNDNQGNLYYVRVMELSCRTPSPAIGLSANKKVVPYTYSPT